MKNITLLLISMTLLSFSPKTPVSASTTLVPNQYLMDGQTLVSEGQRFELGFFTPSTSTSNRYLGIWYKEISPQTVVWVANRNTPLTNSSGVLKMDENGILILLNGDKSVIWSSNQTKFAENPIARLLYSGNLVVTDNQESYYWQSFEHATDTQLQGMKLGWNSEIGVNNTLVSWRSDDDPSTGNFSSVVGPSGAPEVYLLHDQTRIFRILTSGGPQMKSVDRFIPNFVINGSQKYFSFTVNDSVVSRIVVDNSGKLQRLVWLDGKRGWIPVWYAQVDQCDTYNKCGPYAICETKDSQYCTCVKGFEPNNKTLWDYKSGGCVRKRDFQCGKDDGFLKLKGIKLPDCSQAYYNESMNLKECEKMCRNNCSCTAYAATGGGACINWMGDLIDLREYSTRHQDLYVRLAASEIGNNNKLITIIITVVVISMAFLLGLTIFLAWKKRMLKRKAMRKGHMSKRKDLPPSDMFLLEEHKNDDLDLPLINFQMIAATTENFSDDNKLGEGGFGFVYKGTLADGQQIAVKRLSKNSGQGVDEFKNEVMLIAKLQHRNLVKLLGFCIDGEEKMLIYEYMPNKSLDFFLFDKAKSLLIDWSKRFNIIVGIARGLLYLHQDSRLRIIHRDLKASNVLLDDEMNPKISDFGMARIFGNNQTEANTIRVVGTYGYMSPEYAMDGLFSTKSDVFSYGVLVLEIISGKKNKGFYTSSSELNLLGYAWRVWKEGKALELMDESLNDTCSTHEVLKCIHIGLLCVQEHADDRPSISSVISMLDSEHAILSQPQQPGFSVGKTPKGAYSSSNDQETCSVNDITVTMLEAR